MTQRDDAGQPCDGAEAPLLLAFDERTRAALTLRMAGYSEPQVLKLLARGHRLHDAADAGRRAA